MFILPIFILITISSTAMTLDIQKKIVGGVYSKHGEFPYLVSIQYLGLHLCGGSIINERQVLTAAHCFFFENGTALNISNMNIMAGRNELISTSYAFYTKINQTKLHPKYKQFDFDIAIVELNNSLPIGHPNISTINLEDTNPVNGTNCTAAGWGYDGKVEAVSNRLRVANVTIMNNRTCFMKYFLEDISLQPDIICAGDSERDSCQGDSGGPLVCSKKLVGIISSGVGCAYANYPGLYTSVAYHRRWIEENTKNRTKNVIDHPIITPPVDNNVNITNTNHTTNITNMNHTINATDRPVVFNPHGYAHNGTQKPPKRSGVSDLRPSTIIFFLLCLLMSSIKRFD